MTAPRPSSTTDRLLALFFLAFLLVFGAANLPTLRTAWTFARTARATTLVERRSTLEKKFAEKLFLKEQFLNLNARVHLALGRRTMNGVVKDDDGYLYALEPFPAFRSDAVAAMASIQTLYRRVHSQGRPFLFVQRPCKIIRGRTRLPASLYDSNNDRFDLRVAILRADGIPVFDLRDHLGDRLQFFRTDHHWTVRSAFEATRLVIAELNARFGLGLDPEGTLLAADRFEARRFNDVFLGSQGVRTGPLFAGRDDFEILLPTFPTDFHYRHFTRHHKDKEAQGDFVEAFVNFRLLDNPVYKNKFNACLKGGYIENVVINRRADNDLKLLFIADSFARPMVQYLSLCFRETRQLDPQADRYTDSYLDYIEAYQPDVVMVMFEGPVQL